MSSTDIRAILISFYRAWIGGNYCAVIVSDGGGVLTVGSVGAADLSEFDHDFKQPGSAAGAPPCWLSGVTGGG
jgi:hypothetical protein